MTSSILDELFKDSGYDAAVARMREREDTLLKIMEHSIHQTIFPILETNDPDVIHKLVLAHLAFVEQTMKPIIETQNKAIGILKTVTNKDAKSDG